MGVQRNEIRHKFGGIKKGSVEEIIFKIDAEVRYSFDKEIWE